MTECPNPACEQRITDEITSIKDNVKKHDSILVGEDQKSGLLIDTKDKISRGAFWQIVVVFGASLLIAMAVLYRIALSGPPAEDVAKAKIDIVQLQLATSKIEICAVSIKESVDRLESVVASHANSTNNVCRELEAKINNVEKEMIKINGGRK